MHILLFLAVGALAGWLVGQTMKDRGFGLIGNIIAGVVGALIGAFLGMTLTSTGFIGALIMAAIGAVLLVFLGGLFKKEKVAA